MILKKLILENVRAHKASVFELSGGMTALTGRNGVGKSTLLEALFFALTGKCATDGRTRPGLLRWGCRKGSVTLEFEAGGVEFNLSRGIPDSKDRISWTEDGKRVAVTKMGEVSQKMGELMGGVDADTLLLSSFMPQGGAMRMVFGTPSERQREYATLFRLAHLDKSRRTLQAAITEIETIPDHSDEIERLSREVATLEPELAEIQDSLAVTRASIASGTGLYADLKARAGRPTVEQLETRREALSGQISEASDKLAELKALLETLPEPVRADPERSRKASAYRELDKVMTDLAAASSELGANQEALDSEGARPEVPDDKPMTALASSIGSDEARLRDLEKWKKLGSCPTCGSSAPYNSGEEMALLRSHIDSDRLKLKNMKIDADKVRAKLSALDGMERRRDASQATVDRLEARATELSTMVENFDPEEHAAWEIRAADSLRTEKVRSNTSLEISKLERDLVSLEATLKSLDDADAVEAVTEEYEIFMGDHEEALRTLPKLITREAEVRTRLEGHRASIESMTKWMAYRLVCEAQRARLAKAREILHVDKLPRVLLQGYRETLSSAVNKYLAKFNQPFMTKVDDSLETQCVFGDGNSGSAGDVLSGGQRVLLTVCYRLAVTELLAGWVSLLVFDEPTPHLDADNRAALGEAFKLVKAYLKSQSIQTIVATHEPELLAVADAEIRL